MRKTPQVGFHALIDSLRLAIYMGMIGRAHMKLGADILEQFLPKVTGEDSVTIRDDGPWEAMDFVDTVHIQQSNLGFRTGVGKGKEVSIFSALVHDDPETIELD